MSRRSRLFVSTPVKDWGQSPLSRVSDTEINPLLFNPVLWLDASDTSTISESGGAVSQWNDKSGNGYHVTQGTAANQPTTGTRTQNALNVIDFDGNDVLSSGFDIGEITSSRALTVFAVVAADQTATSAAVLALGRGTTSWDLSSGFQVLWIAGNDIRTSIGDGSGFASANNFRQVDNGSLTTNTVLLGFEVAASSNTFNTYNNGGTAVTTAVGGGSMSVSNYLATGSEDHRLVVGARTQGSPTSGLGAYWDGLVAEVVIYDKLLATEERQLVRDYLNAKWSVY